MDYGQWADRPLTIVDYEQGAVNPKSYFSLFLYLFVGRVVGINYYVIINSIKSIY